MHLQFFCVKFYVSFCRRLCLCGNSGPQIILRICATLFCAQAISLSCIPLYHTDAAHKLNMPVHHLVVAWPPPIHQPVLFFQLLPPGVHRAGHLPRSQPIAVTPTLSTASMNFLWFPSFPPALQLHPQYPLSKIFMIRPLHVQTSWVSPFFVFNTAFQIWQSYIHSEDDGL